MNVFLYVVLACPRVQLPPAAEPTATHDMASIAAWVDDLAGDSTRWNATRAMGQLRASYTDAEPYLFQALWSLDRQQRQLAAFILMTEEERSGHPDILIAAAVEALADDDLPGYGEASGVMPHVNNMKAAVRFLREPIRGRLAAPQLRRLIGDPSDWQARLFAADILARCGDRASRHRVVLALLEHVQDNDRRGDAAVALKALNAMGPAILPQIEGWLPLDEQSAAGKDLLLRHLTGMPPSAALLDSMPYRAITTCVRDPIAEHWAGPLLF